MSQGKVKEVLTNITNRIIEKLERVQQGEDISPWDSPWEGDPMPINFTTGEYYSGINVFNLWYAAESKEYTSNEWCTVKQLLSYAKQKNLEVSFKGEKTTPIIRWVDDWVPKEKKMQEENASPIGFWRVYHVLNRNQINGLPPKDKVNKDSIVKTRTHIADWINRINPTLKVGGDRAFYQPKLDYIGMPELDRFKSEDHYWNVLFHELTHWTAHETRLDRRLSLEKKDYAFEELIAEMGAALTSAMMGVPSRVNHESYINGYIKLLRYDYTALRKAASQAGQAYEYLLNFEKRKEVAWPHVA